MKDVLNTAQVK